MLFTLMLLPSCAAINDPMAGTMGYTPTKYSMVVWTDFCSYGCQNSKLLNGLLKTELGFNGYVMSDWYGAEQHTPV